MNRMWLMFVVPVIAVLTLDQGALVAQETPATEKPAAEKAEATDAGEAKQADREQRLAAYLSGSKFVGAFTIDGKDVGSKAEEYTISKCEKLPQPDMYRMTARIKYGDTDSEVPLDIKILWSGSTPVITLDSFWIPGMGTFGSRVLIHGDRYAGTWRHDEVGGHMFGKIVKE